MTDVRSVSSGVPLKEGNRTQIWIIIVANTVFLYGIVQADAIKLDGLRAALTSSQNFVSMGIALVLATLLNGLISAEMKARLVFLRWHYALPGHRAFTQCARQDSRIDVLALEEMQGGHLPVEPEAQNRAWYRIYRDVEHDPAVQQVHKDFLLMRDYAGLSFVFIFLYGIAGGYAIGSHRVAVIYVALLAVQFLLSRHAASNYGKRMVTTVLARGGDAVVRPPAE